MVLKPRITNLRKIVDSKKMKWNYVPKVTICVSLCISCNLAGQKHQVAKKSGGTTLETPFSQSVPTPRALTAGDSSKPEIQGVELVVFDDGSPGVVFRGIPGNGQEIPRVGFEPQLISIAADKFKPVFVKKVENARETLGLFEIDHNLYWVVLN